MDLVRAPARGDQSPLQNWKSRSSKDSSTREAHLELVTERQPSFFKTLHEKNQVLKANAVIVCCFLAALKSLLDICSYAIETPS
jgi:hypothetical protein